MGKSKGKLFFSLVGLAFGASAAGMKAFGVKSALTGALYGMSLGSTIWSAMHPVKNENTAKFDSGANIESSEAMIPIIYGTCQVGGIQSWYKRHNDGKKLTKDIILCEGEIDSIYGGTLNDLLVSNSSSITTTYTCISEDKTVATSSYTLATNHLFSIYNYSYEDAYVQVWKTDSPTSGDKKLRLYANGQSTDIILCDGSSDLDRSDMQNYNGVVSELIKHISELGNGWAIANPVPTSNWCQKINNLGVTNCYNNPVSLTMDILDEASYIFHNGSPYQSPPDNYETVGGYKNMAWVRVSMEIGDDLTGGNPTFQAIVKGRKVYDPRTGITQWSDNPALCVRDFLLSKRYGAGHMVTADMLDDDSFKEAADYFDEVVSYRDSNGNLCYEKRATLDIVLNERKSPMDILGDIFANCGAFLTFTNNKISLRVEKPTAVSYAFNMDNIVMDSVSFTQTPLDNTPNRYAITYSEPSNNWQDIKILVEDVVDQQQRGKIIPKDITLKGTKRQSQALRLGRLYRDINRINSVIIQFQTTTFAMHLEPGDVITVTYKELITDMPFRILEISEQKGTWTIKAQQYNESIYNDDADAEIQVKNYTTIQSALSDKVMDVSDLSVSQTYYRLKDGTIVSDIVGTCTLPSYINYSCIIVDYSTDGGYTYTTYGTFNDGSFVIHNAKTLTNYLVRVRVENTVGRRSTGVISDNIYITGKDVAPSDVSTFTLTQDTLDTTKVLFQWGNIGDIDLKGYEIRQGESFDDGAAIADTIYGSQFSYTIDTSGTYTFWIKAIDWSNNYSEKAKDVTTAITVEPKDITGFSAVQNGDTVVLSWNKPSEASVVGVEIREGSTWSNGTLVTTGYSDTLISVPVDTETTKRYHIKAINRAGLYSKNALTANITIANLPAKNIVNEYNELTLQTGTCSNVQFGSSNTTCLNFGGKCSDYVLIHCSDVGGAVALRLKISNGVYPTTGEYITEVKDVSKVLTATLSTEFRSNVLLNNSLSTKLQFRTSQNNSTWSEWTDFQPVLQTFRYIQFKVILTTEDTTKSPEVGTFIERVDVPDVEKVGSTVTIPVGGKYVSFGYTFSAVPVVSPIAIGLGLSADLISKDSNGFTVRVLNLSGTDVGGTIDWRAKGY